VSAATDGAGASDRRLDRARRRRRRRGLRWLAIAAWLVVLSTWGARLLIAIVASLLFANFRVWDVVHTAASPDGGLHAIAERGDDGALGWGPRRIVVARADDRSESEVVFVAPDRRFTLEPVWTGECTLQVVVCAHREATREESAELLGTRRFEVAGARVEVQVRWREWGEP
jgi:hypothetical protein